MFRQLPHGMVVVSVAGGQLTGEQFATVIDDNV
jgi:CO dehydrogenase/acetyl-CoA synthase gamma subunit (corrinoid Fe-S protein)